MSVDHLKSKAFALVRVQQRGSTALGYILTDNTYLPIRILECCTNCSLQRFPTSPSNRMVFVFLMCFYVRLKDPVDSI